MQKSILIVDDSHVVRTIVRTFLDAIQGCMVVGEAADGVEAIDQAKELKPDLILLDLAMPRMNGVEAAPVIKKLLPESKLILFTMYSEQIGQSLASAAGIDDVVSKPEGIGNLIQHLQRFLPSGQ
jgi:DNA-binding NarL/FixJ family response regulator